MSKLLGADGRQARPARSCDFQLEMRVVGPVEQEPAMTSQARRVLAAFVADYADWSRPVTIWFEPIPLAINAAGLGVATVRLRLVGYNAASEFGRAAIEAGFVGNAENRE